MGHGAVLSVAGRPGVNSVLELSCPVLRHDEGLLLLTVCSTVVDLCTIFFFKIKISCVTLPPTIYLPVLHKALDKRPSSSYTLLTATFL